MYVREEWICMNCGRIKRVKEPPIDCYWGCSSKNLRVYWLETADTIIIKDGTHVFVSKRPLSIGEKGMRSDKNSYKVETHLGIYYPVFSCTAVIHKSGDIFARYVYHSTAQKICDWLNENDIAINEWGFAATKMQQEGIGAVGLNWPLYGL